MKFAVYGGYQIPRLNGLINSSAKSKQKFWDTIEEDIEGLASACGCYVFVAQKRPWYIGLAEKQSFKNECLAHHKLVHYNNILASYKRAAPSLYFIPKLTQGGNFSSPSKNGHFELKTLEQLLIGLALSRNKELVNIRGTKLFREINVPGILNTTPGQSRSHVVQEIRSLFGI